MLSIVLLTLSVVAAIPSAMFVLECIASLLPMRRAVQAMAANDSPRAAVAVLIPAHNEETQIAITIQQVKRQLRDGDRLIVVADNCTDATAERAAEAGAAVLQRTDENHRGKAYALHHGMQHLMSQPPDVVLFLDADSQLGTNALDLLVDRVQRTRRPAQAVYLMHPADPSRPGQILSALAFGVKNLVRGRGMMAMGLPVHLTGTGMAWPWHATQRVGMATGAIVEDMQFGIDLAIAGFPATLVTDARVTSELPASNDAATTQRTRWEHGHLSTMFRQCPRLIWEGIRQRRLGLIGMALDLAIPPLSLLVLLLLGLAAASALGLLMEDTRYALWLSGGCLFAVSMSIMVVWKVFLPQLPMRSIWKVPGYVLWKIPIYLRFAIRPETRWIRTSRDASDHHV